LREEAARVSAAAAQPEPAAQAAPVAAAAPTAVGSLSLSPAAAPAAPELSAAPAPSPQRPVWAEETDDGGQLPLEPYEPPDGLYRRRGGARCGNEPVRGIGGHSRVPPARGVPRGGFAPDAELAPPPDLDELWQQLLEDTLPPDKRKLLQDSWAKCPSQQDRYMMYLEYTSYLRKPEVTEEEQAERRKQLEPLLREFGVSGDGEDGSCPGSLLWPPLLGLLLLAAGVVYYMHSQADPLHDLQAL